MTVVPIEHGLHLAEPTAGYVRTPGRHASDLYGSLFKTLDPKRFDKRDIFGDPLAFDLARMEFGTSFEEALEPSLAGNATAPLMEMTRQAMARRLLGERPGEFVSPEGIIYSPDYLFLEPDSSEVLGEFKLTWMSAKDAPTGKQFAKWHCQAGLYCRWLGLHQVRLFAFFVNGGAAKPYHEHSPELLAWEITYTQRELTDNWNAVERHALKEGLLPV